MNLRPQHLQPHRAPLPLPSPGDSGPRPISPGPRAAPAAGTLAWPPLTPSSAAGTRKLAPAANQPRPCGSAVSRRAGPGRARPARPAGKEPPAHLRTFSEAPRDGREEAGPPGKARTRDWLHSHQSPRTPVARRACREGGSVCALRLAMVVVLGPGGCGLVRALQSAARGSAPPAAVPSEKKQLWRQGGAEGVFSIYPWL